MPTDPILAFVVVDSTFKSALMCHHNISVYLYCSAISLEQVRYEQMNSHLFEKSLSKQRVRERQ